jgi:hypothetical protein
MQFPVQRDRERSPSCQAVIDTEHETRRQNRRLLLRSEVEAEAARRSV